MTKTLSNANLDSCEGLSGRELHSLMLYSFTSKNQRNYTPPGVSIIGLNLGLYVDYWGISIHQRISGLKITHWRECWHERNTPPCKNCQLHTCPFQRALPCSLKGGTALELKKMWNKGGKPPLVYTMYNYFNWKYSYFLPLVNVL